MYTKAIFFTLFLFGSINQVFAHGGAGHGEVKIINELQANSISLEIKDNLLNRGKLEASWGNIKSVKTTKKKLIGSDKIWVMTLHNPSGKDEKSRNLYVFIGENGQYKGANHTGEQYN